MASTYQKTGSDVTCTLASRQALYRQLGSAFSGWTDLRIGMFYSFVGLATDDTVGVTESLTISTYADYFTMGLNVDNVTLPGQSSSSAFIGACGALDQVNANATHTTFAFSGWVEAFTCWGAITGAHGGSNFAGGVYANNNMTGGTYPDPTLTSGYCSFHGLRLVINNYGLSTQTITPYTTNTNSIAGTDYSDANLRTYLQNATWAGSSTGSYAWNTGAAARAIPNYLWLRAAWLNNRLRISNIKVMRFV